jgi:hypothetical protein
MNPADQVIEEIRAVRHRISTEHGHDITKYLASLRAEEKQHVAQLKRGKELLARRNAERKKYPVLSGKAMALRERPKKMKRAMAKQNLTGAPGTKEVAKQLARWREQLS